jgi:hypothetical protein
MLEYAEEPNQECFLRDVQQSRYRDGNINGYASRLHYFSDWLSNNAKRTRLELLSGKLGGKAIKFDYNFMTKRPKKYPALTDSRTFAAIAEAEARLSKAPPPILEGEAIALAQPKIKPGDLLAFVAHKPGICSLQAILQRQR